EFATKKNIGHIHLKQVSYIMTGETTNKEFTEPSTSASIAQVLKALLGLHKTMELYPVESDAVSSAADRFLDTLIEVFQSQQAITFTGIGSALLVNGQKIDVSDFKAAAESFLRFLEFIGVSDLTLVNCVNQQEIISFFRTVLELPKTGGKESVWKEFSDRHNLKGILFNQYSYEMRVALDDGTLGTLADESSGANLPDDEEKPISDESIDVFLRKMPDNIEKLLTCNNEAGIRNTLKRLFLGFSERPLFKRELIINSCRELKETLSLAHAHTYINCIANHISTAFSIEKDWSIMHCAGSLMHDMAMQLIEISDYPSASRILDPLKKKYSELKETKDINAQKLSDRLGKNLEAKTAQLLREDLKSNNTKRQKDSVMLLDSLGSPATSLLIETIKGEQDYRIRCISAALLNRQGPKSVQQLKSCLTLKNNAETRVRILEVIDTVTKDLKTELIQALGDKNQIVRDAGLMLAERLADECSEDALLLYLDAPDVGLVSAAIKLLGRLRSTRPLEKIISLLNSTKEQELLIACCNYLGDLADAAGIQPLAKIITAKRIISRHPKYSPCVRLAAASALKQISHPHTKPILALLAKEKDPRLREMALD
ncbi:MAG: hypothetical protein V1753_03475, partial [Pseudomonadota bacterium]